MASVEDCQGSALCRKHGLHEPQAEQPQYSMLKRQNVEESLRPVTAPRGMGLVVWSPLAMGMLTGKYDEGVPEDSRFGREPWARDRYMTEETAERVRRLKPIADDLGITRAQLALAWVLRHERVSSAITGATRPEQVEENAAAAEVTLPEDVVAGIDEIVGRADLTQE